VAVEKHRLPEVGQNRIRSGCSIDDLLGFWIHFSSPILGRFSLESGFSTATGDFTQNADCERNGDI
jgi:hypothetical protein